MRFCWLFVLFCLISCSPDKKPSSVSFYYWKTRVALQPREKQVLEDNNVEKIYLRYFDIELKNDQPFPISSVIFGEIPNAKIVPVIYIKNEVMLHPKVDVKKLAALMLSYIDQINNHYHLSIQEIQLDCDWSLKSKQKFFSLLRSLKEQRQLTYSATIRLHQIKFFKETGVPPVDYGVLMYYNMGSISSGSINSIYERSIAQQYIKSLTSYPLHLQIALPIFSWGVHIRNGRVVNLINRLRKDDLLKHNGFQRIAPEKFRVVKDGTYFGQLFALDDIIKTEEIREEQLTEMVDDLRKYIKKQPSEIIFYDLDQQNIRNYEENIFKKVATRF